MTKLAITTLTAIGLAAAAWATLPAPVVSAAGPASGSSCSSDELGNTATSTDGTTLRCLATEQGGYKWTAGTGDAVGTIKQLQDQGYTVNIDRVGTGPLDKCQVTDVRNPLTITRLNRENGTTHGGDLVPIVVSKTIKVSLDCTGNS
jgi:hypothetical protein